VTLVHIKDLGRGEFSVRMRITEANIEMPALCSPTELTTSFRIDGAGTPLVVRTDQSWKCRGTGGRFLATP
jgi:hypothetical protein